MNPWLLLGALVAFGAACGGSYWYGTDVGQAQCEAKQKTTADFAREMKEAAQTGAAEAIAKQRPRNTTIVNEVQREIQNNTVYAECKHTPAGLRGINEALTGRRADRAGDSQLP